MRKILAATAIVALAANPVAYLGYRYGNHLLPRKTACSQTYRTVEEYQNYAFDILAWGIKNGSKEFYETNCR